MKKHKLELFQLRIYKRVKRYSYVKGSSEAERLEAVQVFYNENTLPLIRLLEKTLTRYPVTTCIFLIHQIDNIVNHHFGIKRDAFTFETINNKVQGNKGNMVEKL